MSKTDSVLEAPPRPPGVQSYLIWKWAGFQRFWKPLGSEEIREKIEQWQRENAAPDPKGAVEGLNSEHCCLMNIPGVGERCSSRPTSDAECRDFAKTFHASATGRFYPGRPCAYCKSIEP